MAETIEKSTTMEHEEKEEEKTTDIPVDIIKLQQEFYEMFGHKASVIYDCYTEKVELEVKIDLLMPEMNKAKKMQLVDLIWSQKKYMGDKHLFMSPIFVCCIYDHNIKDHLTYPLNIQSKRFSIHPVFRVQKCLGTATDENGQTKCCAIFIDEFGRAYVNWKDFREKNKYEDGLVIAPRTGIYNGSSSNDQVLLDIFVRKSGLTKNLDTGSTVVGLASAGVAAATFIPSLAVAPVVVGAAALAGISCAVYTGIRSAYDLYDRKYHKQSIALKDREARASWFNIAAGTLSASAAGATKLMTQAASSGQNISHLTRNTVRFMNLGALSLHTTGCLDGFHTMLYNFYNGEPVSKVHLAQLSASLFLLTHSISNFQAAEQLIRSSDSNNPDSMKDILRERQKTSFNHLVNETILIRGLRTDVGQIIIRSIKSLGNCKELLDYIESNKKMLTEDVKEKEKIEETSEELKEKEAAAAQTPSQEEVDLKNEATFNSATPSVAREYCEVFDIRLKSIVSKLTNQVNNRGESSLQLILLLLLNQMTFKTYNKFLNFVQELMVRISCSLEKQMQTQVNFETYLKLAYAQFVERSEKEKFLDLNNYILSLDDDKMHFIDFQIREYLKEQTAESIENLEISFDAAHIYQADLSDNRKVFLMIEERVEEFGSKFKMCCATANVNELHETIEEILKRLSYESAAIFFALAKKLLNDHAVTIQLSLGRFISVDIFITDIYCLLTKISADDDCDTLNEYLFQYTDDLYDKIETQFKNSYVLEHESSLKKTQCSVCAGEAFV
ncbi:uncharacterized protein LOC116340207 [Contarinia nasturtii]|uniref:uncharacterized protein LOC116340207 n=1 Tax=Contarinia nasturtii TaxID=265458 RepID=UPI0012D395D9|nr:uncharacterized protein LOC116340207 [Contarinia nasturtii]XP_031622412.1 uncharacterized protein LOC116340207 [Contarinia nasturtii]